MQTLEGGVKTRFYHHTETNMKKKSEYINTVTQKLYLGIYNAVSLSTTQPCCVKEEAVCPSCQKKLYVIGKILNIRDFDKYFCQPCIEDVRKEIKPYDSTVYLHNKKS